jgi:DNA-binding XRE family transcriptional regulator
MRCILAIMTHVPAEHIAARFMKRLKRLTIYVRPYRIRWGLSQKDLAFLIGFKSRKAISFLENHKLPPSLAVAIALCVVFGTEHADLFPAIYAEAVEDVLARANDLYERLQGNSSKKIREKLDFLEAMLDRAKRQRLYATQL